jgi:hypothetical protein
MTSKFAGETTSLLLKDFHKNCAISFVKNLPHSLTVHCQKYAIVFVTNSMALAWSLLGALFGTRMEEDQL